MNVLQIALDKEGNFKSVYEVKTGIECECFCPECKSPLEAKNKNKTSNESLSKGQKIAHFAHYDGSNCASAPETAMHLLAKKILSENKTLFLPPLYHNSTKLSKEMKVVFDKAEVEKEINKDSLRIKPDVILYKNNKELYVEFFKTHQVDDEKIEKLKILGTSCVEIDLNYIEPLVDGQINIKELTEMLESEYTCSDWIYNTQEETLVKKEQERLLKEEQEKNRLKELEEKARLEQIKFIEKSNAEQAERTEAFKNKLLSQGYEFQKVYEYTNYDYNTYFNEHNGRSKTYRRVDSREENIYCPMQKENGKNKRIGLDECKICQYHQRIIFEGNYVKTVACGFKNKLTRK
jgi:hypothetical protein